MRDQSREIRAKKVKMTIAVLFAVAFSFYIGFIFLASTGRL